MPYYPVYMNSYNIWVNWLDPNWEPPEGTDGTPEAYLTDSEVHKNKRYNHPPPGWLPNTTAPVDNGDGSTTTNTGPRVKYPNDPLTQEEIDFYNNIANNAPKNEF
jgi:hypothetical protein